ncbi:DUF6777 domain-containing protein [Streptomyces sp. NPDC127084]|uniref:DUF6777 domain-containing protein n=1 Tax=Streptomyces sp. NPDC127084 TaxID=3347133 RepID=UPI00364663E0
MASLGAVLALVTAVILAFALQGGGIGGGGKAKGEIFLETTSASGKDPFTPSTVSDPGEEAKAADAAAPVAGNATRVVDGAHPGLYGGTKKAASCDVEKQITYLSRDAAKGKAFAGVLGIRQPDIPSYLRSLTPVRLGWDTRVTNHGYTDQAATSYQATLQAGTAVLIDDRGVPRVRCASGNPLTPPVTVKGAKAYTGQKWASFRPAALVVVTPAEKPMKTVTLFDHEHKGWIARPSGDQSAGKDREVPAPKGQPSGETPPVLRDEQSPHEEKKPEAPKSPDEQNTEHTDQPGKTPETPGKPETPETPEQKPEKKPQEQQPEEQPKQNPEQQQEPQSPAPLSPEPQSPGQKQDQPRKPQEQPQKPKQEDQPVPPLPIPLPQSPQLPRLPDYVLPGLSEHQQQPPQSDPS